ncbi:hypothetical protein BpHYR1_015396 [Brachionus plicatilis]|uniref:Uncharacterized protein n=1 Tax=Brachionus plicatilis TaxID=10195 RepID=A0A3M7RUJ5_BRAPC|nr:hypothetical protein BpHYR1_015396 [Brachionus plicatilis]
MIVKILLLTGADNHLGTLILIGMRTGHGSGTGCGTGYGCGTGTLTGILTGVGTATGCDLGTVKEKSVSVSNSIKPNQYQSVSVLRPSVSASTSFKAISPILEN